MGIEVFARTAKRKVAGHKEDLFGGRTHIYTVLECGHEQFPYAEVGEEVYCFRCPHTDGSPAWSWIKEVQGE